MQRSAQLLGPAAHTGEPEPSASDGIRVEPDAVIDDVEAHRRGLAGEGDDHPAGLSVTTCVGQRFLGYPQERSFDLDRQALIIPVERMSMTGEPLRGSGTVSSTRAERRVRSSSSTGALMGNPSVVLADEPTAALDDARGREIMALLAELTTTRQTATVVVTHAPHQLHDPDHALNLADGALHPATARDAAPL